MIRRFAGACCLAALVLTQTGCAGGVESWIVRTRNAQGDRAVQNGNINEAALAYRLALQIKPLDSHARTGFVAVQLSIANRAFRNGKLDEAIEDLAVAAKVDPKNPSVSDLRDQLDQVRLKREIVLSNYPSYKGAGNDIVRSYAQLRLLNAQIMASLKRFSYTYDTEDITRAIAVSYVLGSEVTKNRVRLVQFRQAVESGAGSEADGESLSAPSSLLPLP